MPKVTLLVKGWAETRVIVANIYWLMSHSVRISVLIPDLIDVSQQLCEVSIVSSVHKRGTGKFRNPVKS